MAIPPHLIGFLPHDAGAGSAVTMVCAKLIEKQEFPEENEWGSAFPK